MQPIQTAATASGSPTYSTIDAENAVSVIKVGGSLLTMSDLAARLASFLEHNSALRPVLVIGGGASADIVREWDRIHQLGEENAHWLAIHSLRLNEELLHTILPDSAVVVDQRGIEDAHRNNQIPILNSLAFIQSRESQSQNPLPHNWNVTSDSISAWVALELKAFSLVLLKSCELDDKETPVSSVDGYFWSLVPSLSSIGWTNLRAAEDTVEWLHNSDAPSLLL